jgi:hypothetical protein
MQEGDTVKLLAQAAGVSAAAGSPWGSVFKATGALAATDGAFDGTTATARIEGVRYWLSPVDNWSAVPEATRLRQRGDYILLLRSERQDRPLGLFALRPKLASGVAELVQTCQRYGVELGILASGDQLAV